MNELSLSIKKERLKAQFIRRSGSRIKTDDDREWKYVVNAGSFILHAWSDVGEYVHYPFSIPFLSNADIRLMLSKE